MEYVPRWNNPFYSTLTNIVSRLVEMRKRIAYHSQSFLIDRFAIDIVEKKMNEKLGKEEK